jgi:long-subunit fatty acid transport protein
MSLAAAGRQRGAAIRVAVGVVLLLASVGVPRALTDEEIFREFAFNFTNPGARSLGMAGAYMAIADDATAAQANPAGLDYLVDPEFFFEIRSIDRDTAVFDSYLGSLEVDLVTGERDLPFLGLTSTADFDTTEVVSFVSVVWPMQVGQGRRLNLAGSRQVVLDQDQSLGTGSTSTRARFSFDSFPNTVVGSTIQAYSVDTPVRGNSSTEIVYWNASGSLEIHTDFSVGLTLTYATLDLEADTLTGVFDPLQLFVDPGHPRRPAQPGLDLYRTTIDDTDSDFTYTFGVHLHPDSAFASGVSPWRFGVVYREGASFSVTETTFLNQVPDQVIQNEVIVPDRYGIGISYRASPRWLLSLDVERVEYSDLLEGFQGGVNYLTSGRVAGEAFGINPDQPVEYDIDDGTVPRFGVEYAYPLRRHQSRRLAFWAGYFHLPDDRIEMTRFNSTDQAVNAVYEDAFRGGDSSDHFTAGAGYTVGRSSFQLAGETSDEGTQIVGSYIFRFGEAKRVIGGLEAAESP